MKWDTQRVVFVVGAIAVVVLLVWAMQTPDTQPQEQPETPPGPQVTGNLPDQAPAPPAPPAEPPSDETTPGETPPPAPPAPPQDEYKVITKHSAQLPDTPEAALAAYKQGLTALEAQDIIAARRWLSAALLSEQLADSQEKDARDKLITLAQETIISRKVRKDDPYTFRYELKAGDMLGSLERRLKLHVPVDLIMRINRISDPSRVRAGQTLKLIRGPFHAVVNKRTLNMDLYLHRDGLEPVYVCRMRVGLGREDGTPTGLWRVELGGKGRRMAWYPPPSSGLKGRIEWGEPDYAFGEKGIWIPLEGLDENTQDRTGYGIHSTSFPDSIGKRESLGCIRLGDRDIELVYATLYEKWSTIRVVNGH